MTSHDTISMVIVIWHKQLELKRSLKVHWKPVNNRKKESACSRDSDSIMASTMLGTLLVHMPIDPMEEPPQRIAKCKITPIG